MKNDTPEGVTGPGFQNTRDVEAYAKTRMEKILGDFQHAIANIRTGRATIGLFENIRADCYGTPTPLNQLATLHVPEPSLITVQPWDASHISAIEKAIRGSDLGLNPGNDGKLIRVPIPPLTEERRRDLVKKLHGVVEDHRVALRNVRRDANESVKKLLNDKLVSEDDDRLARGEVQKLTDAHSQKLDQAYRIKEKEILEIK